jgi:putative colanic acid biosynthesis glycosyltransferase
MISIVTVVRNDLPGLKRTYRSLPAEAEGRVIEWVVVDGASTDGSAEWLARVRDGRLSYRSAPDGGIYDAMNQGTAMSSGDHVLFLNAGDELADRHVLTEAIERLDQTCDLAYGDAIEVDENGRAKLRPARPPAWIRRGMFTHHQAMLFRRSRLVSSGYRTRFTLSADYDLVARWLAEGAATQHLGLTLVRFHLGGRSDGERRSGVREDFVIRREVLGVGPVAARGLAAAHLVHLGIKRTVPRLARHWRSGRR